MLVKDLIRQKRIEKNLTMEELGKLVGVSGATVSRWESGSMATMKQTRIKRLADALGLSPLDLLPPFREEAAPAPVFAVTVDEQDLIIKIRQLSPDKRSHVSAFVDFLFAQDNTAAEKKEA